METQVNWEMWMSAVHPNEPNEFDRFIELLLEEYEEYTPEFAAKECKIPVEQVIEAGEVVANAGSQLAHMSGAVQRLETWRHAGQPNLAFPQCPDWLGRNCRRNKPNSWSKFEPSLFDVPPDPDGWNELHFPPEYTLAHFEMSHILPHLVKDAEHNGCLLYHVSSIQFEDISKMASLE